jgi:hypothetical protein
MKNKFNGKYILSTIFCFALLNTAFAGTVNVANPDQVGDATAYVMPTPLPSEFNQQVSMDRSFSNMEQFAVRLQSLSGFKVLVNNQSTEPSTNQVKIYQINGTLSSLLDQASLKFNARWKFDPQTVSIILMYNQGISKAVLAAQKQAVVAKTLPLDQQTRTWTISKNDIELRTALARWAKDAGWQLDWQVQGKFPIDFDWQVQGTFRDAVNHVLKASQQSEIPLTATMFTNNHVLRITSTGN